MRMLVFVCCLWACRGFACPLTPTFRFDESIGGSDLIVWATYNLESIQRGGDKPFEKMELEILETLHGEPLDHLTLYPHESLGAFLLSNSNNPRPRLFFIKKQGDHWELTDELAHLLIDEKDYDHYRSVIWQYLGLKEIPEPERSSHLIDWYLELIENESTKWDAHLLFSMMVRNQDGLSDWFETPVFMRSGDDPNPLSMLQRARLVETILADPDLSHMILFSWPMEVDRTKNYLAGLLSDKANFTYDEPSALLTHIHFGSPLTGAILQRIEHWYESDEEDLVYDDLQADLYEQVECELVCEIKR